MTAPEVPADEGTLPPLTEEDKAIQRRMAQEVLDEVADEGTLRNKIRNSIATHSGINRALLDEATDDVMEILATELQKARAEGEARAVESWTVGESAELESLRAKLAAAEAVIEKALARWVTADSRDAARGEAGWHGTMRSIPLVNAADDMRDILAGYAAIRSQEPPTGQEQP